MSIQIATKDDPRQRKELRERIAGLLRSHMTAVTQLGDRSPSWSASADKLLSELRALYHALTGSQPTMDEIAEMMQWQKDSDNDVRAQAARQTPPPPPPEKGNDPQHSLTPDTVREYLRQPPSGAGTGSGLEQGNQEVVGGTVPPSAQHGEAPQGTGADDRGVGSEGRQVHTGEG